MIFKNDEGKKLALTFKPRVGEKQYYMVPAKCPEAVNSHYEYDEDIFYVVSMDMWEAINSKCTSDLFFALFDNYIKDIGKSGRYLNALKLFASA